MRPIFVTGEPLQRRDLLKATAWAAPVIAVAVATPAAAASIAQITVAEAYWNAAERRGSLALRSTGREITYNEVAGYTSITVSDSRARLVYDYDQVPTFEFAFPIEPFNSDTGPTEPFTVRFWWAHSVVPSELTVIVPIV